LAQSIRKPPLLLAVNPTSSDDLTSSPGYLRLQLSCCSPRIFRCIILVFLAFLFSAGSFILLSYDGPWSDFFGIFGINDLYRDAIEILLDTPRVCISMLSHWFLLYRFGLFFFFFFLFGRCMRHTDLHLLLGLGHYSPAFSQGRRAFVYISTFSDSSFRLWSSSVSLPVLCIMASVVFREQTEAELFFSLRFLLCLSPSLVIPDYERTRSI
jgi:hypothetical protein